VSSTALPAFMVSKQLQLGRAGHFFQQVTDDFGAPFVLDGFRSRIAGIGPQIGFLVSDRGHAGLFGLKGCKEIAAQNRPRRVEYLADLWHLAGATGYGVARPRCHT